MKLDKKLFLEVHKHQAPSRNAHLQSKFANWILDKCRSFKSPFGFEFDKYGNVFIKKGDGPYPCAVAHLDQVHSFVEDYSVIIHKDYAFAMDNASGTQCGIGGDDKCGIYIALEMFRRFDNIKIAFFTDEEVGGIGSSNCDLNFFDDCCFIIQPDRNHRRYDYINFTNGLSVTSKEFDDAIMPILESYGYKESTGTFTDIGCLKERGLNVVAFNIACGYLNAHTKYEIVDLTALKDCLNAIEEVIDQLSYRQWNHISETGHYKFNNWEDWNNYYSQQNDWKDDLFEDDPLQDIVYDAIYNCPRSTCSEENFIIDLDANVYCSTCGKNFNTFENELNEI